MQSVIVRWFSSLTIKPERGIAVSQPSITRSGRVPYEILESTSNRYFDDLTGTGALDIFPFFVLRVVLLDCERMLQMIQWPIIKQIDIWQH